MGDRIERIVSGFVTDQERRDQLSDGAFEPPPSRTTLGSLAVVALVVPIALLVRLVTAPVRWLVRPQDRAEKAASNRRSALLGQLSEDSSRLDSSPDDVDSRFGRGLTLLALSAPGHAELDFDGCVRALESGADSKVELAAAIHNRGIARAKLGLPDLHAADRERAASLGFAAPGVSALRAGLGASWHMFRFVSGWS